jgi:hypothetical protein
MVVVFVTPGSLVIYGGLIRHADGAWVHGFYGNLGVTTIFHAELMAIYKDFSLLRS